MADCSKVWRWLTQMLYLSIYLSVNSQHNIHTHSSLNGWENLYHQPQQRVIIRTLQKIFIMQTKNFKNIEKHTWDRKYRSQGKGSHFLLECSRCFAVLILFAKPCCRFCFSFGSICGWMHAGFGFPSGSSRLCWGEILRQIPLETVKWTVPLVDLLRYLTPCESNCSWDILFHEYVVVHEPLLPTAQLSQIPSHFSTERQQWLRIHDPKVSQWDIRAECLIRDLDLYKYSAVFARSFIWRENWKTTMIRVRGHVLEKSNQIRQESWLMKTKRNHEVLERFSATRTICGHIYTWDFSTPVPDDCVDENSLIADGCSLCQLIGQ